MRRSILLAAGLLLVPATATGQGTGTVALTATPALIKFNTTPVAVGGTFSGVQKVAGVRVTLLRALFPFRQFRAYARTQTDASGGFAFTVSPAVNTQYAAVVAGKPTVRSQPVGVLVLRQVTIKLSTARPRAGHRIRVAGFVYPEEDGDVVQLQYETAGGWRTVQSDRTYNVGTTRSAYAFTRRAPRKRTRLRVVLPDDGQHPPSASGVRTLRPR
jgi:hypothetical protein